MRISLVSASVITAASALAVHPTNPALTTAAGSTRAAFLKASGVAAIAATASLTAFSIPTRAEAADSTKTLVSKSGYDLTPMTEAQIQEAAKNLSDLQRKVLLQAGTERAGSGTTVNGVSGSTKEEGTWVSAISGVPVFPSSSKYDSGTGRFNSSLSQGVMRFEELTCSQLRTLR